MVPPPPQLRLIPEGHPRRRQPAAQPRLVILARAVPQRVCAGGGEGRVCVCWGGGQGGGGMQRRSEAAVGAGGWGEAGRRGQGRMQRLSPTRGGRVDSVAKHALLDVALQPPQQVLL